MLKKLISKFYMLSSKSTPMSHKEVVVVLGATGAGKSKLALDIAGLIDGEIISADSMQVLLYFILLYNIILDSIILMYNVILGSTILLYNANKLILRGRKGNLMLNLI